MQISHLFTTKTYMYTQVLPGLNTGLPRMYTMQAPQLLLKKKTEEVSQTLEHLMLCQEQLQTMGFTEEASRQSRFLMEKQFLTGAQTEKQFIMPMEHQKYLNGTM